MMSLNMPEGFIMWLGYEQRLLKIKLGGFDMSKRFSILLVMLTIVSGLVGGVISGKFFATRTVIAAETKQHAKVIEAEEFRLVDKNGKLFGKFAISDDIKISSIEYGTSPALILYSSDGKLTANLGITEVLQPDIGVSLSSASLLLQSSTVDIVLTFRHPVQDQV
jgi:uncharacterized protein YneF (UPF0154 family)